MTSMYSPTVHGFLIPFPQTRGTKVNAPKCFLYALPAVLPPEPAQGQKEGKVMRARRKWEKKSTKYKTKGGFRGKSFTALDKAIAATKSAPIEFLSRCPDKKHLREIILHYPASMPENELKATFDSLLVTTQKKATRNTIVTGILLPITFGVDLLLFFWPLPGPFFPVDAVAFYASVTGRSKAKYILQSYTLGTIQITFVPDPNVNLAENYLTKAVYERACKKKNINVVNYLTPVVSNPLNHLVTDYELQQTLEMSLGVNTLEQPPPVGSLEKPNPIANSYVEDFKKQVQKGSREFVRKVAKK
eukprot:TRINITY_DN6434_c0_g1_i1.p1 TRINITY_DN6434_c0_g1~~TRINITY_DN6434_c0_g1_i1.p1  ORF type:complete len:303 (+),score=72.42 TRINITY_DN6434_c0_g1_i1:125-1033(+)